jgi:hypothetical protein
MENIVSEAAPRYNFISLQEYLDVERASDEKHEYFMIDTVKQRVYIAKKSANHQWFFDTPVETGSIFIETINFSLPLYDIYKGTGI